MQIIQSTRTALSHTNFKSSLYKTILSCCTKCFSPSLPAVIVIKNILATDGRHRYNIIHGPGNDMKKIKLNKQTNKQTMNELNEGRNEHCRLSFGLIILKANYGVIYSTVYDDVNLSPTRIVKGLLLSITGVPIVTPCKIVIIIDCENLHGTMCIFFPRSFSCTGNLFLLWPIKCRRSSIYNFHPFLILPIGKPERGVGGKFNLCKMYIWNLSMYYPSYLIIMKMSKVLNSFIYDLKICREKILGNIIMPNINKYK